MSGSNPHTSLVEKLEMKKGLTVFILNPPPGYETMLGTLPIGMHFKNRPAPNLDFIQYFAYSRRDLSGELQELERLLSTEGALWISWPKKTSAIKTDLSETIVREIGVKNGLVDVKACSIDETWSALKFVHSHEGDRAI
jgi:hypothetical protein